MNLVEIQKSIETGKFPDSPKPRDQDLSYLEWLKMPQTVRMLSTLKDKRASLLEAAEGTRDNPTQSRALLEQAWTIKEVLKVINELTYA